MADVEKLIGRIRANGANVAFEGGRLRIVNGDKLPHDAIDYIKAHGRQIADWLEREHDFEERAAMVEYGAGVPRDIAERFARECVDLARTSLSELDRSWLLNRAGLFVDEVGEVLRNPDNREAA